MTAVEVHAVVDGPAGAPVVLLSGSLGSTLEMWDAQVAALSERFRVVRYDTRGHGRSPVPDGPYDLDDLVDDALALLDRLGVARAHVVGLSLGGATAMRLAARAPARVERLALLCTSARFPAPAAWTERAATVRSQGTASVAGAVVERWFTPAWQAAHPELTEHWRTVIGATAAEGYASCCEALAGTDLVPELGSICAPTLAIAGADDPASPPEHLRTIADGIPGARLVVLPDAAHLAALEQPVAVGALLLAHLDPPGGDPHSRGMQVRRAVLGDAHVDRSIARTTPLTRPFQDWITRYAWGDVWTRPGLDRRSRSMITLALLAGLGHEAELALHVRGAVNNGLSAQEIAEVLLHTSVYAGVPAGNSALAIAAQVLDGLGLTADGGPEGAPEPDEADPRP